MLTFSTLFVTTLAITRERERGTMENLLAMPVRPIEVMIAKIVPYVVIGYVQVGLILVASVVFFGLPMRGSLPLLLGALGLFIACEPRPRRDLLDHRRQPDAGGPARPVHPHAVVHAVGVHVPVPRHAGLGAGRRQRLPTTHAMRIVRGMLLKGNGWNEIAPEMWPMALFTVVVIVFAVWRYRETLD